MAGSDAKEQAQGAAGFGVRSAGPHDLHPTARKILEAARKVLLERGYQAMTLQAIADQAQVNKAGVWYYFGGKQQLVFALLEDAVGRRDRISLVAFRSGVPEAAVALRPTSSLRLAAGRLREIPLSGRTPLPHALFVAGRLLRQEIAKRPNARPVAVVVSDGLPNVPLRPGGDAFADVLREGRALRRGGITCLVLDATAPGQPLNQSCGAALAEVTGGTHLPLADVVPGIFLDVLVKMP